jgi:hypothetical protein
MDDWCETYASGCFRRRTRVCSKRCGPYPSRESQPSSMVMPRAGRPPAPGQGGEMAAARMVQQQYPHTWALSPTNNCPTPQQPALVHELHLSANAQLVSVQHLSEIRLGLSFCPLRGVSSMLVCMLHIACSTEHNPRVVSSGSPAKP